MPNSPTPKKGKKHESASPAARTLGARFGDNGNSEGRRRVFVWPDEHAKRMFDVVRIACASGCGVMFGTTRDGGAGVITLFDGDERRKWYPSTSDEIEHALAEIQWAFMSDDERRERGLFSRADVMLEVNKKHG